MKFTSRRILQQSRNYSNVQCFCKVYITESTLLSAISSNGRVLHVLSGDQIVLTVQCPWRVQDACISAVKSTCLYLLVLGPLGTIYSAELPSTLEASSSVGTRYGTPGEDSDSIFDDLLQTEGCKDSGDAKIILKTEDMILRQPGVKQLASMGEYLVTMVEAASVYRLHIYRWTNDGNCPRKLEQVSTVNVDNLSDKTITSDVDAAICFACPTESPSPVQNPAENLYLDRPLYGQLFGSQYGLLDTPMLLFGAPSGHVYAIPLHQQVSTQRALEPKLLCDLQQPVAAFYSLRLSAESNGHKNRLCILGYNGKVLSLAHSGSGQSSSEEYYISGPVVCSVKVGLEIVHCTGSQFLVTDLRQLTEKEIYSHLQSEIYSAGQAISMAAHIGKTSQTREWLSITKAGHVYKHTLSEVATDAPAPSTHRSHSSLKDLLTGISHSAEELLRTQKQVASLDSILTQLALAAYITQNPIEQKDQNVTSCPLKFTASIDFQNLGPETLMSLRVRLLNRSGVGLTAGWVLTVLVSAKPGIDSSWSWPGNISRSTPLVDQLAQGESQDVVIPLTQAHLTSLPLSVDGFVTYSPVTPHCSTAPVMLPVGFVVIDILHCLQSERSRIQPMTTPITDAEQSLLEIAKSRPCWSLSERQLIADNSQTRTGHLNMKTLVKESQLPSAKQKGNELSAEVRLLHHLLADSNINIPDNGTQITLRSVAGNHPVSISVKKAADDTLEVCWGSDDIRTVGWLHTAVTARLQNLGNYSEVPHGNALVSKCEEVGQQAHTLRDRTCEAAHSRHQLAKDAVSLYTTLRDMAL